jgi:hypothetical protein
MMIPPPDSGFLGVVPLPGHVDVAPEHEDGSSGRARRRAGIESSAWLRLELVGESGNLKAVNSNRFNAAGVRRHFLGPLHREIARRFSQSTGDAGPQKGPRVMSRWLTAYSRHRLTPSSGLRQRGAPDASDRREPTQSLANRSARSRNDVSTHADDLHIQVRLVRKCRSQLAHTVRSPTMPIRTLRGDTTPRGPAGRPRARPLT